MKFGIGQPATRKEDERFLKGAGTYVDDITLEGQAYGVVFRSPVAHARITSLDTKSARAADGVLGVYTSTDCQAVGFGGLEPQIGLRNSDGSLRRAVPHPVLAEDKVYYVGQPVAFIVAETKTQALDAAELIEFDYDELAPVIGAEHAIAEDAELLHEVAPANICYDWEIGDKSSVDSALATAAHIIEMKVRNPRIIVNAIEPRACNAEFSEETGWTLHVVTQGSHTTRDILCAMTGMPTEVIRVKTPDVGGGFGMKLMTHMEYPMCMLAAAELGRPVKWTADRGESFLGDYQGRDLTSEVRAGFDAEGRLLAIEADSLSNLGAYAAQYGVGVHTVFCADLLPTVYKVPAAYTRVRGVFTTTTPVDAYRGAGRPEIIYMVELLINKAAQQLGIDQAELRRRNFVPAAEMPHTTVMGVTFDTGDYNKVLDAALKFADWAGFEARAAQSVGAGKLRGRGLTYYMERTGGGPYETARIQINADGNVEIWAGTQTNGQGHETAFAQIVHERLGVPFEAISMRAGDTDLLPRGGGTGGSRSLLMAGQSFDLAANDLIAKAKEAAAEALEAASADIEFDAGAGGILRITGTDRSLSLIDLAAQHSAEPLLGVGEVNESTNTFPNGCHICEVEVDPATGMIDLQRYHVVDDFGFLLNPLLVKGQIQGGVVQGIGQVFTEAAKYDADTGQLLTGSYMDYGMPRADQLCSIKTEFANTPSTSNPMGVKGCGEAGAVGATPCVMVAALNAIASGGGDVEGLDMPLTPAKVWHALRREAKVA